MARLLLVEDERLLLTDLAEQFPWHECGITQLMTAQNGQEAWVICQRERPDILLTDIRMPGMTGLDLARQVQTLEYPVAVIFISAYSDIAYLREALRLHAADYLLKPVDEDELARVLMRAQYALEHSARMRERSDMVHQYTDELRGSVLSAILLKRGDSAMLMAQAEIVGLVSGEDWWCVLMSPAQALLGGEQMEQLARKHLSELVQEAIDIPLEEGAAAVLRLSGKPLAAALDAIQQDAARFFSDGDGKSIELFITDSLDSLYGLGSEFVLQLQSKQAFGSGSLSNADALCRRIVSYIDQHYMEYDLSVSTMSRELHYTASYICTVFRKEYGQTIHSYINQQRLYHARVLLRNTSLPVSRIAEMTGYENENYFSRMFKSDAGVSPLRYRRNP